MNDQTPTVSIESNYCLIFFRFSELNVAFICLWDSLQALKATLTITKPPLSERNCSPFLPPCLFCPKLLTQLLCLLSSVLFGKKGRAWNLSNQKLVLTLWKSSSNKNKFIAVNGWVKFYVTREASFKTFCKDKQHLFNLFSCFIVSLTAMPRRAVRIV